MEHHLISSLTLRLNHHDGYIYIGRVGMLIFFVVPSRGLLLLRKEIHGIENGSLMPSVIGGLRRLLQRCRWKMKGRGTSMMMMIVMIWTMQLGYTVSTATVRTAGCIMAVAAAA